MKNNIMRLYFLLCQKFIFTLNVIFGLFCNYRLSYGDNAMQSGELIVTGKDKVEISLKHKPKHFKVEFKDDVIVIPCNPIHHDDLEYEIKEHHHDHDHNQCHYTLFIKWNVSAVREIVWSVKF